MSQAQFHKFRKEAEYSTLFSKFMHKHFGAARLAHDLSVFDSLLHVSVRGVLTDDRLERIKMFLEELLEADEAVGEFVTEELTVEPSSRGYNYRFRFTIGESASIDEDEA